jgi:hypothetical protein
MTSMPPAAIVTPLGSALKSAGTVKKVRSGGTNEPVHSVSRCLGTEGGMTSGSNFNDAQGTPFD